MKLSCFFLMVIIISSCEKDDQYVTEKIISHGWKLSFYKWNNVDQFLDDCAKDDCFTFKADSSYTITNTIKCTVDEPDITDDPSMKWSISKDGGTFYLHYGSDITNGYSIKINSKKMILTSDGGYYQKTYVPC